MKTHFKNIMFALFMVMALLPQGASAQLVSKEEIAVKGTDGDGNEGVYVFRKSDLGTDMPVRIQGQNGFYRSSGVSGWVYTTQDDGELVYKVPRGYSGSFPQQLQPHRTLTVDARDVIDLTAFGDLGEALLNIIISLSAIAAIILVGRAALRALRIRP